VAEERDDVEVAWARIVADYDRQIDPGTGRWPAQEDVDEPTDEVSATDPVENVDPADLLRPGASTDWAAREAAEPRERDDHFVPPPPPPLVRPDLPSGIAWAGLLGGPAMLLLATVLGWALPSLLTAACVVGFIGGLVYLLATMDDRRDGDGWDNGAQV
jgi:hypothetical protein